MSNIISIHHLFQFLILIHIIPIYITIKTELKIVFLDGFNVIRCSDHLVQVYDQNDDSTLVLSKIKPCKNADNLYSAKYFGLKWDELRIICSSDNNQVHEEQDIYIQVPGENIDPLTAVGQLDQSTEIYELRAEYNYDELSIKIRSNDQPANDAYFSKKSGIKVRRIYIWLQGHPIICRLEFTGNEDNPCPSMHEQKIDDVHHACYYNSGSEAAPTIEEMEAELKQVEEATKPDTNIYVLDLNRPEIVPIDPSGPSDSSAVDPSDPNEKPQPSKQQQLPPHSPNPKKKQSVPKTIGLVIGILALIALIGGGAFYMIRKHRSSTSSSSSTSIETGGNNYLPSLAPNESNQSLPVASVNDTNKGLSMKKEQPTIELQVPGEKKRQRTGTSMMFNEDI